MPVSDSFFHIYFVEPLLRNGWFNPVNSIVYGICLLLGFLLVFKILKQLKVKIDYKLMFALLPFVFWASSTRAIRDFVYYRVLENVSTDPVFFGNLFYNFSLVSKEAYEYISSIVNIPLLTKISSIIIGFFPTPFSYLMAFLLALVCLLVALWIQNRWKIKYWKTMFGFGFIFCLWNIMIFPLKSILPLIIVLLIFGVWIFVMFGAAFFMRLKPVKEHVSRNRISKNILQCFSYENLGILSAHLFDASATYTAVTFFGFLEQHFVPRFLFSVIGPSSMFLLKIFVILPILYLLDKIEMDPEMKNLIKITIVIMGLAPGIRDTLTLMIR
jgi:uncharacterized membrane protein